VFQKTLITGGAGFIGLHLARALAPMASKVILCDHLVRGRHDADLQRVLDEHRNVSLVTGDLCAAETYEQLGRGFDVVFHLAGIVGVEIVERDPVNVIRNNILSTLRLLEWLAGESSTLLIFSSTSEVYADGVTLGLNAVPTSEAAAAVVADIFNPRASYALSKLVGEHLVAQSSRTGGLRFTIIRYHNVYGPRMGMEHVIPQMSRRIVDGEKPLKVRSAHHTRAFCYIDDAVSATIAVAKTPEALGRIIHVGNDLEETTILRLAELLCEVAGEDRELIAEPHQAGSVARRCPDLSLLRSLTGYAPSIDLPEGLRRTFEWYRPALSAQ
jgi:UDP-glucose 4-epimerase/UDP-glucuronate decarboxylase